MPDGRRPESGGWNRIIVQSSNLEGDIEVLRKAGVKFRNDVVVGPGGRQILLDDLSDNPVEYSSWNTRSSTTPQSDSWRHDRGRIVS
jgi:hypothetical protein